MPRSHQCALDRPPADRQTVRRHRPQIRRGFGEFVLADRRDHRHASSSRSRTPLPRCGVVAVFVLGGADHHPVNPRHQIHLAAVHAGADHPLRHRRQPRRQRSRSTSPFTGRIGSPGHNAGASMPLAMTVKSGPSAPAVREVCHRRCPLNAESLAVRRQRLDNGPVVDGEFVFGDESVPDSCASIGSMSRSAGRLRAGPAQPPIPRRFSGPRRLRGRVRRAGIRRGDDVGGPAVELPVGPPLERRQPS